MNIRPRPESIGALYSELIDQCWRSLFDGHGISFVKKVIKGKTYWYLQRVIGKQKTQHYIGPDNQKTVDQIEKEKSFWEQAKPEIQTRRRLVSMLASGGAETPVHTEALVLKLLERSGVFLAGGVLVGSQAFKQYGNSLGVHLDQKALRTHDVDVAAPVTVSVGIHQGAVDLRQVLLESDLGFFEIPALNRRNPSTSYFIRGQQMRVDLLTPMIGKPDGKPVYLPWLKASAEPVRFLDFLMEDIQRAVVVALDGILVNIPNPSRFALHKLVISQRRNPGEENKARKDIRQAGQLLEVLLEMRPGDVELAVASAKKEKPKFQKQLSAGLNFLDPQTGGVLKKMLLSRNMS